MKTTAVLAVTGVFVVAVGVSLQSYSSASSDTAQTKYWDTGPNGGGGDASEYPLDKIEVPKTMVLGDSKELRVFLKNLEDKKYTGVSVILNAPKFDTSPQETKLAVTMPAKETVQITWIISPKELGDHDLTVDAGFFDHGSATVKVTTLLGLSAGQAELAKILCYVFGPMLTVPFWFTLWQKKREDKPRSKLILPDHLKSD